MSLDDGIILFSDFFTIFGDYDELRKNAMEDSSPFPYDLSEEEFDDEVSYFLGEKPYPKNY